MKVLIINSGSSSVKYQVVDTEQKNYLAKGLVESIGLERSRIKHEKCGNEKVVFEEYMPDHKAAIAKVLSMLIDKTHGVLNSYDDIDAVGHRLVHGGERFKSSVLITDHVMDVLNECIQLAPLHNPANIEGIRAAQHSLPKTAMVGVFDTAFHSTMPDYAYMYPLPYEYYEKYAIRRYGFHGTSHYYVTRRFAELIGRPVEELNLISCHIGNGASVTAVKNGRSVDTSMGYTPLEGLMMGTRCGDVDGGAFLKIAENENMSINDMNMMLNKKSGIIGIYKKSSDLRDVEEDIEKGDDRARLALDMYNYRIKKYIGAYAAVLGRVDGIIFTGGVGENADLTRGPVCRDMEYMDLKLDEKKNRETVRGKEGFIHAKDSKVMIAVIPTNEELVIALETENSIKENY
ncbi:MAG: acetate kinase [Candidatus Neomarinimicrobiota bacterium]|jgi:acetate kinase|nr:acetate kinase [Candidatus Neomarinimicrobiota bacterium]MDX9780361.1 acetate kinase [bacterium]